MKEVLLEKTSKELSVLVESLGQPKFRGGQLYRWLVAGAEFCDMSNLPKEFRSRLEAEFVAQPVKIIKTVESSDGTKKFLFQMTDGVIVEGVLMSYKYGKTVCISTQAGCRMNCAFCASGLEGLFRNLTSAEILGQVVAVNVAEVNNKSEVKADKAGKNDAVNADKAGKKAYISAQIKDGLKTEQHEKLGEKDASSAPPACGERPREITNIVLMGSGEPLDNFDNVLKFLGLVNEKDGLNVSGRNISLSTCGLPEKMVKLADFDVKPTLTVSLHAADDETRTRIMPINKAHSIDEVIAAAKKYFEKTGRRVVFEYAMIKGVNDRPCDAENLAKLLKGFSAHVNLIRLNDVKEKALIGSSAAAVKDFKNRLEKLGVSVTLRRIMGSDIDGACGQLRNKFVGCSDDKNTPK